MQTSQLLASSVWNCSHFVLTGLRTPFPTQNIAGPRVLLSLALTSGACPSAHPEFEPRPLRIGGACVSIRHLHQLYKLTVGYIHGKANVMQAIWESNSVLLRRPDLMRGIRQELTDNNGVSLRSCRALLIVIDDDRWTNLTVSRISPRMRSGNKHLPCERTRIQTLGEIMDMHHWWALMTAELKSGASRVQGWPENLRFLCWEPSSKGSQSKQKKLRSIRWQAWSLHCSGHETKSEQKDWKVIVMRDLRVVEYLRQRIDEWLGRARCHPYGHSSNWFLSSTVI